jgi:hypothetical protein
MASLTIKPGSRIRLKGQAAHIPDFFVVRCDRNHCWVRQADWIPEVQLNVRFNQILIPETEGFSPAEGQTSVESNRPDNVIYLDDYRQRRAR